MRDVFILLAATTLLPSLGTGCAKPLEVQAIAPETGSSTGGPGSHGNPFDHARERLSGDGAGMAARVYCEDGVLQSAAVTFSAEAGPRAFGSRLLWKEPGAADPLTLPRNNLQQIHALQPAGPVRGGAGLVLFEAERLIPGSRGLELAQKGAYLGAFQLATRETVAILLAPFSGASDTDRAVQAHAPFGPPLHRIWAERDGALALVPDFPANQYRLLWLSPLGPELSLAAPSLLLEVPLDPRSHFNPVMESRTRRVIMERWDGRARGWRTVLFAPGTEETSPVAEATPPSALEPVDQLAAGFLQTGEAYWLEVGRRSLSFVKKVSRQAPDAIPLWAERPENTQVYGQVLVVEEGKTLFLWIPVKSPLGWQIRRWTIRDHTATDDGIIVELPTQNASLTGLALLPGSRTTLLLSVSTPGGSRLFRAFADGAAGTAPEQITRSGCAFPTLGWQEEGSTP